MSRSKTRHPADDAGRRSGHSESVSSTRLSSGASVAAKDHVPSAPGVVCGRPIRLLVVDDDVRVRAAIDQTIALESDLLVVADAADAATARIAADRADPSVALVDVLLPDDLTGLALVRGLSQRPGCAVVAMSVRGGLREPALAAGAVAFVEKGGDIDALLDAVRAASRRHLA
jgi:DNA-binding NtrC family response regulator